MLTFKDTQLRLCSKMLRFSPRYLTFQKMSTFQATQLLSCAYRSAYVPSSYAIISKGTLSIPCQVTLTFQDTQLRIRFQDAYAPKDTVTFQATQLLSYAYTLQDTFRLRYNIKKYASNPESSYAYVPRSAATVTFQNTFSQTLLNPSRFPSPKSKKLSLWITLQGPPVNICLAENTVQNFFTIQKFRWALGISLQHFKFN